MGCKTLECSLEGGRSFGVKPLSANPTNCLSVFDHFVGFALKGLRVKSS